MLVDPASIPLGRRRAQTCGPLVEPTCRLAPPQDTTQTVHDTRRWILSLPAARPWCLANQRRFHENFMNVEHDHHEHDTDGSIVPMNSMKFHVLLSTHLRAAFHAAELDKIQNNIEQKKTLSWVKDSWVSNRLRTNHSRFMRPMFFFASQSRPGQWTDRAGPRSCKGERRKGGWARKGQGTSNEMIISF